ncbi:hypothetical protein HID58_095494 [Brassica napus]|uniref:Cytidine/deoxycytidylate deaminase zinc-binding domain-containing protein n=1 Tax=Brassica napus TaxID=3708 RepID=A0ABQ7X3D8_BRANA|nr:hypothetical protein HID58_095494 [Brassica napus]
MTETRRRTKTRQRRVRWRRSAVEAENPEASAAEEWGDGGFVAVGLGSSPPLRRFRDVAVSAARYSDADSDGFLRLGSNLPHRFSPEDLLDKDFPLILEHRDNNLTISDRDPISNGNTDSAVELKHAALAAANRLCPSGASVVVVKKKMVHHCHPQPRLVIICRHSSPSQHGQIDAIFLAVVVMFGIGVTSFHR